jgi:hypothetical protein
VIGVPSDRWGETVKAIVTARQGVAIEPADVVAFARTQLARLKVSDQCGRSCRHAEHCHREDSEDPPTRALLDRPRPPHQLTADVRSPFSNAAPMLLQQTRIHDRSDDDPQVSR